MLIENSLYGVTFMIAEDEILIALSLEEFLIGHGATCLAPVGSISEAMAMISTSRFDMALLDIDLRGMRIDPVADQLSMAGIPFVFVTGSGEDALPSAHRHRPVIMKPYSDAELIDALVRHRPQIG